VWLLLFFLLTSCQQVPYEMVEIRGETMGTRYLLKCEAAPADRIAIEQGVDSILAQFDAEWSNWNSSSWVSQFNRSRSLEWQPAPRHVIDVLIRARDIHTLTGGALEVTLTPLIELWGFGVKGAKEMKEDGGKSGISGIPSSDEIAALMSRVGMDKVQIDPANLRVRKKHPEVTLNVSALAKGYVVDLIAEYLSRQGTERYLVEVGGEIRAAAPCVGTAPWTIGMRNPDSSVKGLQTQLVLRRGAVATSGDYVKYFEREGVRYSHLINPATGSPVLHQLQSVTVIAPDGVTADALATACMVMGTQPALALIEQMEEVEAYFITTAPQEERRILKSKGFSAYEKSDN